MGLECEDTKGRESCLETQVDVSDGTRKTERFLKKMFLKALIQTVHDTKWTKSSRNIKWKIEYAHPDSITD